ncbi:hypothetical protein ID866_10584 [Astraeus odoratus]|nr:hypothetical protein ID866_10584 [Astraeus odoratus]
MIFFTDHSDEDRGDIFIGSKEGVLIASKVSEVLELLLRPLKDIVNGAHMIFYVCGSTVRDENSFKEIKEAMQE